VTSTESPLLSVARYGPHSAPGQVPTAPLWVVVTRLGDRELTRAEEDTHVLYNYVLSLASPQTAVPMVTQESRSPAVGCA
jgi:hypothetical protein